MKAKHLYILTLVSAFFLILVMGFLFYLGNQLAKEHSQIEAIEEIKLEVTTAHLWFEEIMSGDRSESIEGVWQDINDANWYATSMLEGGKNNEGIYYALDDEHLRSNIISLRETLNEFKRIAQKRHQYFADSLPGSDIDTQFDIVFHKFIQQASDVEQLTKKNLNNQYDQYRLTSLILIVSSAIISLILSQFLYTREKNRVTLIESLQQANLSIEEKNKKLNYMAHFDVLTGLPNRVLFRDRLEQAIIHSKRNNYFLSLLFIDLDQFKAVNDKYGHQYGDELLKQVSQKLKNCIRETDTAVRISGDEFVVILSEITDFKSAIKVSNSVAAHILKKIQQPFDLYNSTIHISASIGIALYPEDGLNGEEIIKHADTAMYHVKSKGKNNFQFYSNEIGKIAQRQLEIEYDLRIAIKEDQFELYFHPQWNLSTGKICGVEVLVRWLHPEHGLIFPDTFIFVAESSGLIEQLDLLIISKALTQLKLWNNAVVDIGSMAINISPISFCRTDFFKKFKKLIIDTDVNPKCLELEITESVLVENVVQSQELLLKMQAFGIKIAIDDFGTGFSSMSYLKDFNIDTLKIDRSFISEFNQSNTAQVILKNMINLGLDLGMQVVAEGIETAEQESYLKTLNCTIGQGFLLAKPLQVLELEKLLGLNLKIDSKIEKFKN